MCLCTVTVVDCGVLDGDTVGTVSVPSVGVLCGIAALAETTDGDV